MSLATLTVGFYLSGYVVKKFKVAGFLCCAVCLAGCDYGIEKKNSKDFDFSLYSASLGLTASVCADSLDDNVTYSMNFGTASSDGNCVSNTFSGPGVYEAVVDARRNGVTKTKRITVTVEADRYAAPQGYQLQTPGVKEEQKKSETGSDSIESSDSKTDSGESESKVESKPSEETKKEESKPAVEAKPEDNKSGTETKPAAGTDKPAADDSQGNGIIFETDSPDDSQNTSSNENTSGGNDSASQTEKSVEGNTDSGEKKSETESNPDSGNEAETSGTADAKTETGTSTGTESGTEVRPDEKQQESTPASGDQKSDSGASESSAGEETKPDEKSAEGENKPEGDQPNEGESKTDSGEPEGGETPAGDDNGGEISMDELSW